MKRKLPSLDKRYAKHRALSQDEKELWREEVGGKKEKETGAKELKNWRTEEPKRGKILPSRIQDSRFSSSITKPRRSGISFDATLDLHGHTKVQAHAALLHFITDAQDNDIRLALVITGKGRGGAGTLREELPRWLKESPFREHITAYDVAMPRHGGEGAWYVRIRKWKPDGRK